MSEQATLDDSAFIDVVCDLVDKAHKSQDPRIMSMMDAGIQEIHKRDLLPTILLRYNALKEREDELTKEITDMEDRSAYFEARKQSV